MPTQAVSSKKMKVGKKGGGKHWTQAEVDARAKAAEALERGDDASLVPPIWLGKDALEIWNKKVAEVKGLKGGDELLDVLDGEVLALFCDAVSRYMKISSKKRLSMDDHKLLQTYQLRILSYSERLGFTPGARARLVKKRSENPGKDEFGEKFD